MKKILIAAGSQKNLDALSSMVATVTEAELTMVDSGLFVRTKLTDAADETDLVVINTPLADTQGADIALFAAERMYPVIIISSKEICEKHAEAFEERGALAVARPLNRDSFARKLKDVIALSGMVKELRLKNLELHETIEEFRLVGRAKAILMENLKMSESQAHRYIEKHAMDLRVSRKKIAQGILGTYHKR